MSLPGVPAAAPRVSVIIPAYNQARFLADAVNSVLAQTCRDFEIVIVDDGSTDETPTVAQGFFDAAPWDAAGSNRVRLFRQENRGLAGARNTGIRQARGEFIALLDSDDLWLPGFLEKMLALAGDHPEAAVLYCGWRYVDEGGRLLPEAPHLTVIPPMEMHARMLRANQLNVCTVLLRREAVLQAGLFDESFRRLEDWDLWLRLLEEVCTFVGLKEPLVLYRLHGSSLSADAAEMKRVSTRLVEKHFGPPDGPSASWPAEKRLAYGGMYRYHAITALSRQGDWPACRKYLGKALASDPSLARDFELFYELALGSQPPGFRGAKQPADLKENAAHLLDALRDIFRSKEVDRGLRREVFATAYRAMGIVAYNRGELALSRRYLLAALRQQPALARDPALAGALAKSILGVTILHRLRRRRGAQPKPVPASPGEPDTSGRSR